MITFLMRHFFLPLMGLTIKIQTIGEDLKQLFQHSLKGGYSTVSLIECWFLIHIQTIDMLSKSKTLLPISPLNKGITTLQNYIYNSGHIDYFDPIIISSALTTSRTLVTMDRQFVDLVQGLEEWRERFFPHFKGVISWMDFREALIISDTDQNNESSLEST